jgi:hypothetical protein
MPPIRLYWWPGSRRGTVPNYGDAISPLLVEHLARRPVRYAPPRSADLIAVGSLLTDVLGHRWKRVVTGRFDRLRCWGTGAFTADGLRPAAWLEVGALRGTLTRDAMGVPTSTPVGDPGLLVPRLLDRQPVRTIRWGIVPHYIERDLPAIQRLVADNPTARLIDLNHPDLLATTRMIGSCHFIISSSLHGLIVADAFGIPNVWASWSTRLAGGSWKFRDYGTAVGRDFAQPVGEDLGDLRALEAAASHASPSVVAERSAGLERAFASFGL